MKVQFGANDNALHGWVNFKNENECDIRNRLPFADDIVDRIFLEHCLEHVTMRDAWNFLDEALRILKPGGVIRIVVPAVDQILRQTNDDYRQFMTQQAPQWFPAAGLPKPEAPISDKNIVKAIIFCHGHQSAWTEDLLAAFMAAVGFEVARCAYGRSHYPELHNIDSHWKYIGLERCVIESVVCEGRKPE